MRCLNCGWDNQQSATTCLKCGVQLRMVNEEAMQNNVFARKTSMDNSEVVPKKTVLNVSMHSDRSRETTIFSSAEDKNISSARVTTECSNCGYIIAPGFTSCPNCGTDFQPKAQEAAAHSNKKIPSHKSTVIRPIKNVLQKCDSCRCSLTIIPEKDENIVEEKYSFDGESVILNRENTEVTNDTITLQEQAEIVFEDGRWYLMDKSALQTTYIHVGRKMEILSGDIIVLGNRRFKFQQE